MICGALILAGSLMAFQKPPDQPAAVADRVTLRDGSVVLGLVTSVSSGPRGAVELLVKRDWAETHVKTWASKWGRTIDNGSRLAAHDRRDRLRSWRRERAATSRGDDRILTWIDQELNRIGDPARLPRAPLMPVHLSRSDVRSLARQPQTSTRLLQLGWLCGLQNVETMPLDDLKDALEGRGFAIGGNRVPSLAGLLPLAAESELAWLGHRAATELAIDPDLRLLRYQNMVLPDSQGVQAQALGGNGLSTAIGEISRLLDPEQVKEDPLVAKLKKIGDSGRIGVLVTRLDIPADMAQATVESTLWVRTGADRWVPFVTRSASVRLDDLAPDAGRNIAGDPQVQTAFSIMESLGLGNIAPEFKQRSLRMGAATEKALGGARAAITQDLNLLMLPVFDAPGDAQSPPRQPGKP